MIEPFKEVVCSRCKRTPKHSFLTGEFFVTYICHEGCGNIFWTVKRCPNEKCKAKNETKLLTKPKTGELIKCSKCEFECCFFKCPYEECKACMYRSAEMYQMGQVTSCTECNQEFKMVVCSCGREIYRSPGEVIYEGISELDCEECGKKVCFAICPECQCPDYYFEKQEIGDKIKCSHCKKTRNFIPCPNCGRTTNSKSFAFNEPIECTYCFKNFEFIQCPMGCGENYYYKEECNVPYRTCKRGCGHKFIAVNCNKCRYPLYIESYDFGYGREEECPMCKNEIKFHLCECGLLTKNETKCQQQTCPKPKGVKNYSKIYQEETKKKSVIESTLNSGYDEKTCKLCYEINSEMVNETCRHMMMCSNCYKSLKQRHGEIFKCPICKQPGKYHKFMEPILQ